jgi:hypothetical protein
MQDEILVRFLDSYEKDKEDNNKQSSMRTIPAVLAEFSAFLAKTNDMELYIKYEKYLQFNFWSFYLHMKHLTKEFYYRFYDKIDDKMMLEKCKSIDIEVLESFIPDANKNQRNSFSDTHIRYAVINNNYLKLNKKN